MEFELTNKEREYLGLEKVEQFWDKFQLTDEIWLYFDGDIIKKAISISENSYKEEQMNEETENRKILLPKTKKGKPKKLNFSSFQARSGIHTYFSYSSKYGVRIGNYTTKKTFYETYFERISIPDFSSLKKWLNRFIKETTFDDLIKIKTFSKEERILVKIKAGDFFAFKVDRWNYGFGRVLLDIRKLTKDGVFEKTKHKGLTALMGQPVTIMIYHKISESKEIDLHELNKIKALPAQHIMDNRLFYNDFEIIGNLPLELREYNFPVSYNSYKIEDKEIAYLQYGLIYKESSNPKFDKSFGVPYEKYLKLSDYETRMNKYRNEGIGFALKTTKSIIEQCIQDKSNKSFWESSEYEMHEFDLRNPKNKRDKDLIFTHFGIESNKTNIEI